MTAKAIMRTKKLEGKAPVITLDVALANESKIKVAYNNGLLTDKLLRFLLSPQQYFYLADKMLRKYEFDFIARDFGVDVNAVKTGYKRAILILLGYLEALQAE